MQLLPSTGRRLAAWASVGALLTTGVWACGGDTTDASTDCVGPSCVPLGMGGALTTGGAGGVTGPDGPSGVVADFSLVDVNSTSDTAGEPVSPRDYLQRVSAWYFAHAT